jgi:uncharacterized protein RhaS with RHS repeats
MNDANDPRTKLERERRDIDDQIRDRGPRGDERQDLLRRRAALTREIQRLRPGGEARQVWPTLDDVRAELIRTGAITPATREHVLHPHRLPADRVVFRMTARDHEIAAAHLEAGRRELRTWREAFDRVERRSAA